MEYSKKIIQPLVEKYAINPESNETFNLLLTMFDGQVNYQAWAIKAVFSKQTTVKVVSEIKAWSDENQELIKKLSKNGNIVSYKTSGDICMLLTEMNGLSSLKRLKNSVSMFNTDQRKIISNHLELDKLNGLSFTPSSEVNEWLEIFDKFNRLPLDTKKTVINRLSSIRSIYDLKSLLYQALTEKYRWNREDMLAFMQNNTDSTFVVYDKDNIVLLNVGNYRDSNTLCFGRTDWCITNDSSQWRNYVSNYNRTQYFLFNFNLPESDELAHVAFTADKKVGFTAAHSNSDRDMLGVGMTYEGKTTNIFDVISMCNIPIYTLLTKKEKGKYALEESSVRDYIKKEKRLKVVYEKDNLICIEVNSENRSFIEDLLGTTYINPDFICSDRKLYIFFKFDEVDNNRIKNNFFTLAVFEKDKYMDLTIENAYDYYGQTMNKNNVFNNLGVSLLDFIPRNEKNANNILHKCIDLNDEDGAIKLLEENPNININHVLDEKSAIFSAIEHKMFRLTRKMIESNNFNVNKVSGYSQSIAQDMLYIFYRDINSNLTDEDEIEANKIIDTITSNKKLNVNYVDESGDTLLSIAVTTDRLNWLVDKLVNVLKMKNINAINDIMFSAIGMAARHNNVIAMNIIAERPDAVITKEDKSFIVNNYSKLNSINPFSDNLKKLLH